VSYRINDRWSLMGALATAQVKSTITTTTAGVQRTIDVRFRPTVLTIAAGYSF
jgi:outer membrane protein